MRATTFLALLLSVVTHTGCATICVRGGAGFPVFGPKSPPEPKAARSVVLAGKTILELDYGVHQRFVRLRPSSWGLVGEEIGGPLPKGDPVPVPVSKDGTSPAGAGLWVDGTLANVTYVKLTTGDGTVLTKLALSVESVQPHPARRVWLILLPAALAFDIPTFPIQWIIAMCVVA